MAEAIYSWGVVGLLFVSGLWHIAAPVLAERWMSRALVVRAVGIAASGIGYSVPGVAQVVLSAQTDSTVFHRPL